MSVDETITKEVLRVVQPAGVEAAILASEEAHKQDDVLDAWRRDLEAARYAAQRAQKQYDAADPQNRLVADELERRWNQALRYPGSRVRLYWADWAVVAGLSFTSSWAALQGRAVLAKTMLIAIFRRIAFAIFVVAASAFRLGGKTRCRMRKQKRRRPVEQLAGEQRQHLDGACGRRRGKNHEARLSANQLAGRVLWQCSVSGRNFVVDHADADCLPLAETYSATEEIDDGGTTEEVEPAAANAGKEVTNIDAALRGLKFSLAEQIMKFSPINRVAVAMAFILVTALTGCQRLVIDSDKILRSDTDLPEIVGILAGFGTTFAAFPDLLAMLRRRSSEGMNPRMGAIMGAFQILWVYYGLLIASRPVIIWNVMAVLINFLTVGAYAYFLRKEKEKSFGATKSKSS
jgi:MtN3 and saliva related transmembrane protein